MWAQRDFAINNSKLCSEKGYFSKLGLISIVTSVGISAVDIIF